MRLRKFLLVFSYTRLWIFLSSLQEHTLSVTQSDSLIGSVLGGRYELVMRVGRGGTAVVYRGIDRRLGRTVAVKVIHSDLSGDPDYIKRFDREARAAALLSHPNIVAVFDQGHAADRPYIVMEYIAGQSLRSIIAQSAPLPPGLALSYAYEVAKALAAAHDAGIIHRDIKPENVLITNDGQVKVTDFGLAKTTSSQTSTASHGVLMGTMSYIAPEIPQSGASSKASDIYSTGVMIYEMLTGKKPHTGEDLSQVLYKHVNVDIPPPSQALAGQARARIPDYVDALVQACTSRDASLRPADGRVLEERIAEARRSLDAGLLHDAALVKEFSEGTPAPEKTPVSPTPLLTPSDLGVAVGSGGTGRTGVPKLAKATAPQTRSSKTQVRRRRGPIIAIVLVLAILAGLGGIWYWLAVASWTTVPNLTGMTEQTARETVETHQLAFSSMSEYSETVTLGDVIRTTPAIDARIKKGGTVTAWISKGPERYAMPTVVGLAQDDASTALLNAHLTTGTVTEVWDETVPVGIVVSASIDAGEMCKPGTLVDLSVSKGREPIEVVSYVGKTQDEATEGLEGMGLTVNVVDSEYSTTVPEGSVISQDPSEGTLYRGDEVSLVVSKGPEPIPVPSVYGQSLQKAQETLRAAGLYTTIRNQNTFGVQLGIAVGTDPSAGTLVPQGSTVTLIVY